MTSGSQATLDGRHLAVVGLGDATTPVVDRVGRRLEQRWYLAGLERVRLDEGAGSDEVAHAADGAQVVLVTRGPWAGPTTAGWVLVDADGGDAADLARWAEDALLGRPSVPADGGPVVDGPSPDGPVCAC